MNAYEIVQVILVISQCIVSVVGLLLLLVKPFRMWFLGIKKRKQQVTQREEAEEEALKCLIRSEIVRIYYKHKPQCEIRSFEYENVAMLYQSYKDLGGNSFIDHIWGEMQDWTIVQ